MLTTEPTSEMIVEWKRIFEIYHSSLTPNRKSGNEVDQYFREKYAYQLFDNEQFREIASLNITENDCFKSKLPKDTIPNDAINTITSIDEIIFFILASQSIL